MCVGVYVGVCVCVSLTRLILPIMAADDLFPYLSKQCQTYPFMLGLMLLSSLSSVLVDPLSCDTGETSVLDMGFSCMDFVVSVRKP